MIKTKIIATIGPSSESEKQMRAMAKAGVSMFRMNFSHATFEQYKKVKGIVDKLKKSGLDVSIMQDLQGPRIRVGDLGEEGVKMHKDEVFIFSYASKSSKLPKGVIPIDDKQLYKDLKKGDPLYLCNGEIELEVSKVEEQEIYATVLNGGHLTSRKAINIPRTNLKRGSLTRADLKNLEFALKEGVDYVALSFVQSAKDVEKLRKKIGDDKVRIISKIERAIALENIDQIIMASDAVMIARGDLGIETPVENLPIIQKNIVRHAHWHQTPAIIATQVLTSMIDNPHPTRAEVSDISNAVFDGADAIMVSDETSIGSYALDTIRVLKKAIKKTENYISQNNFF